MDEKEEIGYNMDQRHKEKILRSGGKLFLKDPEKGTNDAPAEDPCDPMSARLSLNRRATKKDLTSCRE
jgi:hypothetical protein